MAANDSAVQTGAEKISTNSLTTVNGTNVAADLIEVARVKVGFGLDSELLDVNDAQPLPVVQRGAVIPASAAAAAGAALTLTIPAPAAGRFNYITGWSIALYSTAARTGAAAPVVVTTTNIPGSLAFTFNTAGATGTTDKQIEELTIPIKSTAAATATTIVAPVVTNGIWRLTAYYYQAA